MIVLPVMTNALQHELQQFIAKSRNGDNKDSIYAGEIKSEIVQKIKLLSGETVTHLQIDGCHIRHAYNKSAHNLEPEDLCFFESAVNNALAIEVDTKQKNRGSKIIKFKADIQGEIYFIAGIHRKENGYLDLVTAYRIRKAQRGSTGT